MTLKTDQDPIEPIGLIAGAGRLPFMVAQGIKRAGRPVAVVGLRGSVEPQLADLADRFAQSGPARLGRIIGKLQGWGVHEAVMVGSVSKDGMYSPMRLLRFLPDLRSIRLWYVKLRKDKRDNKVLTAVADELAGEGIHLVSSVKYCEEHLADEGLMTRTAPSASMRADAEFGWHIARQSAALDIGQAVAVKERDIIAVEAIEGTDRMIQRAGELCRVGGWTLIKVARPEQDMRFDVPTVGPETLQRLKQCGGACLVVEAGRTIIVDKPQTLALADKLHIPILGMK